MIGPARVAAYRIVTKVSTGQADLPSAIAAERVSLADARDRGLAAEIATGVQRQRAALDFLIERFSKRAIDRLDPEIVAILRLSLYQLLHLTRVPAPAVVDDAVDLAGRAGKRSASGFVNAVLRAATRSRRSLPLPGRPEDPGDRPAALDYFSVTLSHPRWLAERWYDRFGFDAAEAWLMFNNKAAPLTLRANRLRTTRDDLKKRLSTEGVETAPGRFAPDALVVESGHPITADSGGSFVVQDEASQLVTLLAGPAPGRWVLDACAAPGGKATAIAASLAPEGRLVACDIRERRVDLLRRTVDASGAANIWIVQADLLAPLPFSILFDCVIVDAPCSGLGVLRRDPDIRWRRREEDLPALAASQRQMLQRAATAVAPGGRLVYATCSSEPEENEQVVDAFLRETPGFVPVDAGQAHPLLPSAVVDDRGHLRTSPEHHGLEAFFGAVLERVALYTLFSEMASKARAWNAGQIWTAGKLLLLAGALAGTYGLFAAASMRLALKAREVQVPDLTNRTANEATAIAADLGLTLRVDDSRRLDPKIGAGRVLAQDPGAGTVARRQRSVRIWLSGGQRAAAIPALTGETERAAQLRLAQDGLAVAVLSEIRSQAYPADVVVAQNPGPGVSGADVSLLVNRTDPGTNYVMPDLIGVNGERTATILRGHGFRVAVVGSTPYPGIPAGIVLRQSPQAGFQVPPGEPISLEVSR